MSMWPDLIRVSVGFTSYKFTCGKLILNPTITAIFPVPQVQRHCQHGLTLHSPPHLPHNTTTVVHHLLQTLDHVRPSTPMVYNRLNGGRHRHQASVPSSVLPARYLNRPRQIAPDRTPNVQQGDTQPANPTREEEHTHHATLTVTPPAQRRAINHQYHPDNR